RSRATRQRLLEAAVDGLAELGWARATVAVVSARAGVSRGAAQHHFPTREALFTAALEHMAAERIAELRRRGAALPAGARPAGARRWWRCWWGYMSGRCCAQQCRYGYKRRRTSRCAPWSCRSRCGWPGRHTRSPWTCSAWTRRVPACARPSRGCSTWPGDWAWRTCSPTTRSAEIGSSDVGWQSLKTRLPGADDGASLAYRGKPPPHVRVIPPGSSVGELLS